MDCIFPVNSKKDTLFENCYELFKKEKIPYEILLLIYLIVEPLLKLMKYELNMKNYIQVIILMRIFQIIFIDIILDNSIYKNEGS